MNYKKAVKNIRTILKEYIQKSGLKSLVIGQSGGIDSALTSVLVKPVCDDLGIPLISRSITIVTNKAEEFERANEIGKYFAHNHKYIDLSDAFHVLEKMVVEDYETEDRESFDYRLRLGNVKARTRMIYLYELAGKHKGMVLSTDNYTELLLGFWTLHGDVGDYGILQNLWKMEVYEMAKYLASEMENKEAAAALIACVDATPTDGLGITNSDLDQIGVSSYAEVDEILKKIEKGETDGLENNKVFLRNRNSEFKRSNPYNIPRNLMVN